MRSLANLLKFAFLTLTLAAGSALGDCTSNEYVPGIGCDSSINICEITCPEEGDCVPSPAKGCTDALVVDTITHTDMDEAKCQALCELSDAVEEEAKRCRFWRYELVSNQEEVCSFMTSSQCTVPKVCTAPSCSTGDVGCANGETPDGGNGLGCAAAMSFNAAPGFIHWGCVNEVADLSSPYDPAVAEMPANTLCSTSQRCMDWEAGSLTEGQTLWRKLRVFCDGADGQWKQDPAADGDAAAYTGDTGVLGADGSVAILEHKCVGGEPAPVLVVDLSIAGNGVGADLVCDEPPTIDGTQHTIGAPNHCLLLCDLHIGMTIDASLSENGEYAFVDGAGEVIADGGSVICWQGKRL